MSPLALATPITAQQARELPVRELSRLALESQEISLLTSSVADLDQGESSSFCFSVVQL